MAKQIAVENALLNTLSFCMERNVLCRVLMQGEKWTQHNVWLVLQVSREFVFVLRATDFRFAGYEIHRLSDIVEAVPVPELTEHYHMLSVEPEEKIPELDLESLPEALQSIAAHENLVQAVNWIQTILPGLLSPLSCPMTISMCSVSRRPTCFPWQRFPCLMMLISVP